MPALGVPTSATTARAEAAVAGAEGWVGWGRCMSALARRPRPRERIPLASLAHRALNLQPAKAGQRPRSPLPTCGPQRVPGA